MARRGSVLRRWADERLDGQLDELLRSMRACGYSYDAIAFALQCRDIDVSRETVRTWVRALEQPS